MANHAAATETKGCNMLILTRRIGESIMIGDDVTITVLDVKGNGTRIGVTAPRSIAVHREEIYDRIKRERNAAHEAAAHDPVSSAGANVDVLSE